VEVVLGVQVRELPEADAEAVFLQVGEHLLGVRKARGRELEVAAAWYLEPVGV
jgi:hypothetical protein